MLVDVGPVREILVRQHVCAANRVRARRRGDRDAEEVVTQARCRCSWRRMPRATSRRWSALTTRRATASVFEQLCVRRHRERAIARGGEREQDLRLGLRRRCRARPTEGDRPRGPRWPSRSPTAAVASAAPRMKCRLTNRDPAPTPSHSSASSPSADSAVTGTAEAAEEPLEAQRVLVGRRPHDDVIADVLDQGWRAVAVHRTGRSGPGRSWSVSDRRPWSTSSCSTARSSALKRRLTTPTPAPRR